MSLQNPDGRVSTVASHEGCLANELSVAMVEPVGGHGGMDYYDFGLCGALSDAGVNVVLYTCDKTAAPQSVTYQIRHVYKGVYGKAFIGLRVFRHLKGSLTWLTDCMIARVPICHFHFFGGHLMHLLMVLLAKMFGKKVVITAHDVESFVAESRYLAHIVYGMADRIIVHNQFSKNELKLRLGISEERIDVIKSGNYLHSISRRPEMSEARAHLGISQSARVLLFFGQIKDVKGLDLLIEALPYVVSSHPDAILLIAGKTWKTDFSSYEKLIERLGVQKHCVTHVRFIPDEELPYYYMAADLIVLPYRRIYQSAVVLMALSYGKAVLASDLPPMTELIEDNRTGFLFPSGDSEALGKKIDQVFRDHSSLVNVGEEGRRHMIRSFSWAEAGQLTKKCYLKACGIDESAG